MAEPENFFTESRKKLEAYVNERLLLLKLEALEKTAKMSASLFTAIVLLLLAFFILLFLSLMAGYYFANLTGSLFAGFGIVTAFYTILFVVILKLKKPVIEKNIRNMIISNFFDKQEEDEKDKPAAGE